MVRGSRPFSERGWVDGVRRPSWIFLAGTCYLTYNIIL